MNLSILIQSFAKLFLIMGIGYLAVKRRVVTDNLRVELSNLVIGVTLPALILSSTFLNIEPKLLASLWPLPVAALVIGFFSYGVASVLAKRLNLPDKKAFIITAMFTNNIFLPIPIAVDVFGDATIPAILAYNFGHAILLWFFGMNFIFDSRGSGFSLKRILNTNLLALGAGFLLASFNVAVPSTVLNALETLGQTTTPLAMLLIGINLAGVKVDRTAIRDKALWLSLAVRMLLAPAIVLVVIRTIPMSNIVKLVLALEAPMPPLLSLVPLSQKYGIDTRFVSVAVIIGTPLAMLTVPVYLALTGIL